MRAALDIIAGLTTFPVVKHEVRRLIDPLIQEMRCPPGSDRSFGPQVDPLCRDLDFTLQFEDVCFVSIPSAVFFFFAAWQIIHLLVKPAAFSSRSRILRACKLIIFTLLFASHIAFTLRRDKDAALKTDVSLPADIAKAVATGAALILSAVTHKRSLRPSTLLGLYLPLSLVLDAFRARTLWLLDGTSREAVLMAASLALTLLAFVFESIEERKGLNLGAPEEFSGIWTRTAFSWLMPTLRRGYAKSMTLDDLCSLDRKLESRVLHRQISLAWSKYDIKSRHGLLRASFRSYLPSFLSAVLPRLFLTAFTFAQPILIRETMQIIEQEHPDADYENRLMAAWALVFVGLAISHSIYKYQTSRYVARLRGGLITLVYERCLEIRSVDAGEIAAASLMDTDIERIASSSRGWHETWGSLLDIGIACWLLERQLFLACLAPMVLVVVFISPTSSVSLASQRAQWRWAEKAQDRLQTTGTILGGIEAIKMLGLSRAVSAVLTKLRADEIKASKPYRRLLIANFILPLSPVILAPLATFALYVAMTIYWIQGSLLTVQAFTSLALVTLLTKSAIDFMRVMPTVRRSMDSFNRLQEYCSYASLPDNDGNSNSDSLPESEITLLAEDDDDDDGEPSALPENHTIALHKQSFAWDETGPAVLSNIDVDIKEEAVTTVVGPTGSGKTAFLHSILGEMVSRSPGSKVPATAQKAAENTSFCSQQPWLEKATIKQNITSVLPYNKKWYDEVVAACGLDGDFKQLPWGDLTQFGSKGLTFSDGLKQRIALARAVYSKRRIAILDDIFSDMDGRTIDIIATRLLGRGGLFRRLRSTVVLATHSRQIMELSDIIIVLEDGEITANDSPEKLLQNHLYVGKLGLRLPYDSEEDVYGAPRPPSIHDTLDRFDMAVDPLLDMMEDYESANMGRRRGKFAIYAYYLRNSGWFSVFCYVVLLMGWVFGMESSIVWVKWWAAANSTEPNKDVWTYLKIYAILGAIGSIGACVAAWFAFLPMASRSAARMHSILAETMLRAPFRFFTGTDSGDLTNRFGREMGLIDAELPQHMVYHTSMLVSIMAKVVIIAVFSKYLGVSIPIFGLVVYRLQKYYLHTSHQVRLLAIRAQAPLLTHFDESSAGATTIRAFGWKPYYQERNYRLTDASQRPMYLESCIQGWLDFMLELMVAVLVVVLVGTILIWREQFSAGSVGVSLVTIVGFSGALARLIEARTSLEPGLDAVARVRRFAAETESEERPNKGVYVQASWPQAGAVEFSDVSASYGSSIKADPTNVLEHISLSVQAGQHVAICGRTGSGKTSLILALLQMIETTQGQITIDGLDLSTLSLAEVRSRINVIPQEPYLVPGTIRSNIDPDASASTESITAALKRVKLWDVVQEHGGLNREIDAEAWPAGRKQLLCLARAMVRKSKILVLDKPPNSMYSDTESIMQEVIDSEFHGCTVIAAMHRLEHVRHYDKAAVLENGRLVEFDDPEELMSEESLLADLFWRHAN